MAHCLTHERRMYVCISKYSTQCLYIHEIIIELHGAHSSHTHTFAACVCVCVVSCLDRAPMSVVRQIDARVRQQQRINSLGSSSSGWLRNGLASAQPRLSLGHHR